MRLQVAIVKVGRFQKVDTANMRAALHASICSQLDACGSHCRLAMATHAARSVA